jgi:hypothetical protein
MLRSVRSALVVGLTLLCAPVPGACEVVVGYRDIDPEIDLEVLGPAVEITGTPALDVGFYHEQLYEPLHDGDNCPVVNGLQGGTWVMPALRIEGIYPFAATRCSLTVETGEVVGLITVTTRYFLATDDLFEVQAFPVPVIHASPHEADSVEDLYGLGATLSCEVVDGEGRAGVATREIVLVEG